MVPPTGLQSNQATEPNGHVNVVTVVLVAINSGEVPHVPKPLHYGTTGTVYCTVLSSYSPLDVSSVEQLHNKASNSPYLCWTHPESDK